VQLRVDGGDDCDIGIAPARRLDDLRRAALGTGRSTVAVEPEAARGQQARAFLGRRHRAAGDDKAEDRLRAL